MIDIEPTILVEFGLTCFLFGCIAGMVIAKIMLWLGRSVE